MSTPSANGTANCRVTYVNPVVALALGAAVLAEPITPTALAGLALVLAGTWAVPSGARPGTLRASADA